MTGINDDVWVNLDADHSLQSFSTSVGTEYTHVANERHY